MIASGTGKQDLLIVALGAVGIAAFTVLTQNNFYLDSLFSILLFAGMASAWNIVGGFAGQFSLGHTAFFGIGAYASTILLIKFGLTPWAGMLVGAVLAALAAAILGWSSFRLRGPFFSLATIAFAEVVRIVAVNWRQLTRGSEGLLVPIEREGWLFLNFTDKALYADAALGYLVVAFLVSRWVYRSKLGYQLQALREDEDAAAALGINVRAAKVKATALSAALTAVAGTLYAQYLLYINPEAVLAFNVSLQPAIMSIIGGLGTTLGPILGAFLIVPLGQLMRMWLGGAMHGLHLFVYGAVLVVVVLVIPQGVLGSVQRLITRVRERWWQAVLEVRGLTKSFGGLAAVNRVDLTVEEGQIVGLIGPNGAGKTTFFNLVTGFLRPDQGRIVFQGRDITGLPAHEVTRLGMARTFQVVKPFSGLSVLDNVVVGALARHHRVDEATALAREVIKKVGLEHVAHQMAGSLPIGLRKKLELARALATQPKFLLLDEVMGGLTPPEIAEMMDLIRRLNDEGITILAIEHILHAIMRLSHRIVVLHHGERIAEGTPQEVARDPAVIEAYLGEEFLLA